MCRHSLELFVGFLVGSFGRRFDGRFDGRAYRRAHRRTDGRTDGRSNGRTDGRSNGRAYGGFDDFLHLDFLHFLDFLVGFVCDYAKTFATKARVSSWLK